MSRAKKGIIYRLTMAGGFGLIGYQMFGEVTYYKFMKKDRDEEIKEEKDDQRKLSRFEELAKDGEEEDAATADQLKKDVEAAK